MGKLTEAQKRAKAKYEKKSYVCFNTRFKHNEMDILNNYCQEFECSKNGLIVKATLEKIERETGKTFEKLLEEVWQSKPSD